MNDFCGRAGGSVATGSCSDGGDGGSANGLLSNARAEGITCARLGRGEGNKQSARGLCSSGAEPRSMVKIVFTQPVSRDVRRGNVSRFAGRDDDVRSRPRSWVRDMITMKDIRSANMGVDEWIQNSDVDLVTDNSPPSCNNNGYHNFC